jgi:hypothetical protein
MKPPPPPPQQGTPHILGTCDIDHITNKHGMSTDRSTLETSVQSYSDFLESIADKLNILPHQSFIA